jgi:glutathione-independent formaldehyde dehydrogenase
VIVGDMVEERLAQARSFGCETVDLAAHDDLAEQIEQILGVPEVDASVDCVGFEARGHGRDARASSRRPCSTRRWTSRGPPGVSASPACT